MTEMNDPAEGFERLVHEIGAGLDTTTIFGEPRMLDGKAIIPVASIQYAGGGGGGGGETAGEESGTDVESASGGEGFGGGFGVMAKPLGVIEVEHDGVRWVPVVDYSRLALVWSVIGGMLLLMGFRRLLR